MSKQLTVTIESKVCAFVSGWGSRDLLTEMRGRPPIWSTRQRAWVTTEPTARDLIAVAEARGYRVLMGGEDPAGGRW